MNEFEHRLENRKQKIIESEIAQEKKKQEEKQEETEEDEEDEDESHPGKTPFAEGRPKFTNCKKYLYAFESLPENHLLPQLYSDPRLIITPPLHSNRIHVQFESEQAC